MRLVVSLLLAIAVGAPSTGGEPEGSPVTREIAEAVLAEVTFPVAAQECPTHCQYALCDPSSLHDNWEGILETNGGEEHECLSGHHCATPHACGAVPIPDAALSEVVNNSEFWLAMEAADAEVLRNFVNRNSHRVAFNADRRSIQVMGCGNRLVANIPVTQQQAMGLN